MTHRVYDTICASVFNIVKGTVPFVLERVLICVKSFLGSESGHHCLFFDNNVPTVAGSSW